MPSDFALTTSEIVLHVVRDLAPRHSDGYVIEQIAAELDVATEGAFIRAEKDARAELRRQQAEWMQRLRQIAYAGARAAELAEQMQGEMINARQTVSGPTSAGLTSLEVSEESIPI